MARHRARRRAVACWAPGRDVDVASARAAAGPRARRSRVLVSAAPPAGRPSPPRAPRRDEPEAISPTTLTTMSPGAPSASTIRRSSRPTAATAVLSSTSAEPSLMSSGGRKISGTRSGSSWTSGTPGAKPMTLPPTTSRIGKGTGQPRRRSERGDARKQEKRTSSMCSVWENAIAVAHGSRWSGCAA